MRPLVAYWRAQAIRICCYLDDGLGASQPYSKAAVDAEMVRNTLLAAGFVINEEKSVWQPTEWISWLGIDYDSKENVFKITETRIRFLLESLDYTIDNLPYTTPRKLSRVCGKIMSTMFVVGNLTRLKTRRLYLEIGTPSSWDSRISLKDCSRAIDELFFWKENFSTYNQRKLGITYRPCYQAFSDASGTGLAAHIDIYGEEKVAYKNFMVDETKLSSTWRELYAIYFSLLSFKDFLIGKKIQWHTDNFAASLFFYVW